MLQNMNNNKGYLTQQEIAVLDRALKNQALLGWPHTSYWFYYVENNPIITCYLTVDDIEWSQKNYGTSMLLIKLKM